MWALGTGTLPGTPVRWGRCRSLHPRPRARPQWPQLFPPLKALMAALRSCVLAQLVREHGLGAEEPARTLTGGKPLNCGQFAMKEGGSNVRPDYHSNALSDARPRVPIQASGSTNPTIGAIYQRLVETFERLAISADDIAGVLNPEERFERQVEEQPSPPVEPKSSKPTRKKLVLKNPPLLKELPLASSAKDALNSATRL